MLNIRQSIKKSLIPKMCTVALVPRASPVPICHTQPPNAGLGVLGFTPSPIIYFRKEKNKILHQGAYLGFILEIPLKCP